MEIVIGVTKCEQCHNLIDPVSYIIASGPIDDPFKVYCDTLCMELGRLL